MDRHHETCAALACACPSGPDGNARADDRCCDCELRHLARLRADLAAAKSEIQRVQGLLDRDKTGLAHALALILTEVRGRMWVTDSRGCYEWDDDRYKAEAGDALSKVATIASDALGESGTVANEAFYPRLTVEIDAAKSEAALLRRERDALRGSSPPSLLPAGRGAER